MLVGAAICARVGRKDTQPRQTVELTASERASKRRPYPWARCHWLDLRHEVGGAIWAAIKTPHRDCNIDYFCTSFPAAAWFTRSLLDPRNCTTRGMLHGLLPLLHNANCPIQTPWP